MNIPELFLAIFCIAIVGLVAGCTSNRPFRTSDVRCSSNDPARDCTNAIVEVGPNYKLGFVEFDDQGWFQNTNQLELVKGLIREESGLEGTNKPAGVLILLFVHGWKNNAACNNTNVVEFRAALTEFARAENLTNHQGRKVVGVYAGWRGLSARIEPFKELSFWERKNTAHKVGGYGAMTQLLVDLEELQKDANHPGRAGVARSELIFVGHSFGGAAMYSAIGQIIEERFEQTLQRGQPLKPLGDQVILLNPAFEASRHYNLNRLAVSISKYPETQRPVLSIFTSKGDWATHYFFPLGRFFSTLFEKNRPDGQQAAANIDAVGWFKPFITHDLDYKTNAVTAAAATSQVVATTGKLKPKLHERHTDASLLESINNVHKQRIEWSRPKTVPSIYSFDDCKLNPRAGFKPGDPLLVVSVDKRIMKDHDDIVNPVMLNFLREFIQFCRPEQAPPPK
jgi:hypothetical protein